MAAYVGAVLERAAELRRAHRLEPGDPRPRRQPGLPDVGSLPTRQFRLNRALGTDLLPPDPADCLRIADAADSPPSWSARDAAAAGYRRRRASCSNPAGRSPATPSSC